MNVSWNNMVKDFNNVVACWGETDSEVQNGTEKIELSCNEFLIYSFIQGGKKYFGGVTLLTYDKGDFGVTCESLEEVKSIVLKNY